MSNDQIRGGRTSPEKIFVVMMIITAVFTALLVADIFMAVRSFNSLSDETISYIELQEAADSLMKASDYLTDEAQCFTVLGRREHMENYFTEAEETRRRELAVETMEKALPDSEALSRINDAMNESLSLMDREYYAMKLVLLAQGDSDMPEALKDVAVSEEDLSLSSEGKMELARTMMHDSEYYDRKNRIRDHLDECIEALKIQAREAQYSAQSRMQKELMAMTVLAIAETVAVVLLMCAGYERIITKRKS